MDLVGDDVEDILSALNSFKDLLKESREQDQRINNKLESLSQKVDDYIDMGETREKSLERLEKRFSDLDKRWEDLERKTKSLAECGIDTKSSGAV